MGAKKNRIFICWLLIVVYVPCLRLMDLALHTQQQRYCALAKLWQHEELIVCDCIEHQESSGALWYSAHFNDCGTRAYIDCFYDNDTKQNIHVYFTPFDPMYIEDHDFSCEQSYKKSDFWNIINYHGKLYIEDLLHNDMLRVIIDNIDNYMEILSTYVYFSANKHFFLLPIRALDGQKHVYLYGLSGRVKKVLYFDFLVDLGVFWYPKCGAISPASDRIIICDQNSTIYTYQIPKKVLQSLDV